MIDINYKLTGRGWVDCVISDEKKMVTISASYLSDALGGLLDAVLKLINGENKVYARFDEEPGEYRWVFEKTKSNAVNLTILEFMELYGNKPDEAGKNIFETECDLKDLVAALFKAADKIFKDYGMEKYKEECLEHEFPHKQYEDIGKWLAENAS